MIELEWGKISSSSTILCISNYEEKHVIVAIVDLKTRKKNILKTFNNKDNPTFLFQLNKSCLLVGTCGGCIELWNLDTDTLMDTYEAHKSEKGVSNIIALNDASNLICGDKEEGT